MTRLALVTICLAVAGFTQQGSSPAPLKDDDIVFVDNNPATTTGLYHRQGCIWAARAWPTKIALKDAKSRYFQAHCECTMGVKTPPPCPEVTPAQPASAPATTPMAVEAATSPTPARAVSTPRPRPAAAPKPARQQCAATTKKGTRCSRLASIGSAFCWQHGG